MGQKLLRVDLNKRKIAVADLEGKVLRKYVGGCGDRGEDSV